MFRTTLTFLISPFIALPLILSDIYNKNRYALKIFSIFIGIMAYLFIPSVSMDGAKRYLLYESFMEMSINEFFYGYLVRRADVLFYTLIFVFAKLGIKFQILLFVLATFNTWVTFFMFEKVVEKRKLSNSTYFRFFILVFLTLSYQFLFSGVRNLLGFSFVLLGFYYLFYKNKYILSYVLLILGVLSHFSVIIYLPIFILSRTLNHRYLTLVFFVMFFVGIFLPRNIVKDNFEKIETGYETYDSKIQGYSDITLKRETTTQATFISKQLMRLWWVFALIYLMVNIRNRSRLKYYKATLLFTLPVLLFLFFPVISGRYLYPLKLLFVLLLINDTKINNNIVWQYLFMILLAISPLYDIFRLMTDNFIASYLSLDNLTLLQILLKTYTYNDMLP